MASNTPTTYYNDTKTAQDACKKDFEKIKKECGPDEPQKDPAAAPKPKTRPPMRKLLGSKYLDKGYGKFLSRGGTDNESWMADNCDFLWIPPGPESHQKFLEQLGDLRKDLGEAVEGKLKGMLDGAKDRIKQEAKDLAKKKAGEAAARSGGRWVAGLGGAAVAGWGAVVTEGVATAWNIYDLSTSGYQVVTTGYAAYKDIDKLKQILAEYTDIGKELERLGSQAKDDPQKAVADFMTAAGKLNPCVRARRCSLVPKNKANSLSGAGCCPGQTGHHLIPDAAVKGAGCPGYDYDKAPTVCAEGTGNSHGGSHQKLHDGLERRMNDFKRGSGRDSMPYEKYRDRAVSSFYETFPESRCDRKCLIAQLDDHYKCSGKDLKAVSGKGGERTEKF